MLQCRSASRFLEHSNPTPPGGRTPFIRQKLISRSHGTDGFASDRGWKGKWGRQLPTSQGRDIGSVPANITPLPY